MQGVTRVAVVFEHPDGTRGIAEVIDWRWQILSSVGRGDLDRFELSGYLAPQVGYDSPMPAYEPGSVEAQKGIDQ